MKKVSLYFLLLVLVIAQSCQDDIIGEESVVSVTTPDAVITVATGISGIVVDENNDPMKGVAITLGRENYTTDENGYFIIKETIATVDGAFLSFKEEGYFNGYKFVIPEGGNTAFVRVKMIEKNVTETFEATDGGVVKLENGGSISFPEDAIVNEEGLPYGGEVSVYAHWYNPSSDDLFESMPGDLRGLDKESKLVQLATFGMMAVELEGQNGEQLNLNPENLADLEFPLPDQLLSTAPSTIKMWSFDEDIGYWKEETVAELSDSRYIARVSHFSFWNCDAPFPVINAFGSIVDIDGNGLPFHKICIEAPNLALTGYGWTNSAGNFNGKIPSDENLILKVKDECGNIKKTQEIGPYSNDASLGEIEVKSNDRITITGTLICDGNPLTDGYVNVVVAENKSYIYEINSDGSFVAIIESCKSANITLTAFDRAQGKMSEPIELIDFEEKIPLGQIQVCEELEEFITFKIGNNQEETYLEPTGIIVNGVLEVSYTCWDADRDGINDPAEDSNGDGNFSIADCLLNGGQVGYFDLRILDTLVGSVQSPLSLDASYFQTQILDYTCRQQTCNNTTVEITEDGEFRAGTFMGESPSGESIMGSFRVAAEESLSCSIVSSDATCGENNGSASVIAAGGNGNYSYSWSNGATGQTVSSLAPGVYFVTITDNSTGDSTSCSATVESDGNITCSIEVQDAHCFPGSAEVIVSGGSGNYTYLWSNGLQEEFLDDLTSGDYRVSVTDLENGCIAVCNATVLQVPELVLEIEGTDIFSCNQDNLFLGAFVEGGTPPYLYDWSNGEDTEEIVDLMQGTYSLTVTDSDGCSVEQNIELELMGNPDISVDFQSTFDTCDGELALGTLTAFPINAAEPVNYAWNNGSSEQTIGVEGVGSVYEVTITDALGCEVIDEFQYEADTTYQSISGYIWLDNQFSGELNVLDDRDTLIQGITVTLVSQSNTSIVLSSSTTDNTGRYSIEITEPGEYILQVNPNQTSWNNLSLVEYRFGNDSTRDNEFTDDFITEPFEYNGCKLEWMNLGLKY